MKDSALHRQVRAPFSFSSCCIVFCRSARCSLALGTLTVVRPVPNGRGTAYRPREAYLCTHKHHHKRVSILEPRSIPIPFRLYCEQFENPGDTYRPDSMLKRLGAHLGAATRASVNVTPLPRTRLMAVSLLRAALLVAVFGCGGKQARRSW